MTNRPDPIPDVYRLSDLPVGTDYMTEDGFTFRKNYQDSTSSYFVQVVEWPQRMVTVELPEDVARKIAAEGEWDDHEHWTWVAADACRKALAEQVPNE